MKHSSRLMIAALIAGFAVTAASGDVSASTGKPLLVPVSYGDAPVYKKKSAKKKKSTAKKSAAVAAPAFEQSKTVDAPTEVKIALPSNYNQRHSQALDHALNGNTNAALKILNDLASLPLPHDELDRVYLSTGRIYYQIGQDSQALDAYLSIRQDGPSWFEALEERAYVYMRLGQPQETIASLKTVLSPVFKERVKSEPYFLASLAQLRVCDYKALFSTLDLFKTRYRDRVKGWESSADSVSKANLRETGETIQKMNLVEAEAIQRLYMDDSGKRMSGKVPSIERKKNELTFPMDKDQETKEVWLDEVNDYRVSVKGCPQTLISSSAMATQEK